MIYVRQHELDGLRSEHPKDGKCPKCRAIMQKDERMFPDRVNEFQGPNSPAREVTPCTNYHCEPCNAWIDVLDKQVAMGLQN